MGREKKLGGQGDRTLGMTCSLRTSQCLSGRVGSGRVGSGRVGSGRVGSGRAGPGRAGPGRVGSGVVQNLTGQAGSACEVFKFHELGRIGSGGFEISRVGWG